MPKAWYVLRVASEREEFIRNSIEARAKAKGLQDVISRVVVPSEHVAEIREGKRRVSQQKMFPGYILLEIETNKDGKIDERAWYLITQEVQGILGFLGTSRNEPEPLPEEEVRRILKDMEDRKEKPRPKVEYEVGDRVRIKEGPFENFDGAVEAVDPAKGQLRVSVSIFGRATSVELEYGKVEKI
ncbi:MAG: transcription termination/antitermination protein NusG [Planctomycetota bacterium]|nr:transcription termination/antitermination protein NusG [Planctomycetota bacterium]